MEENFHDFGRTLSREQKREKVKGGGVAFVALGRNVYSVMIGKSAGNNSTEHGENY